VQIFVSEAVLLGSEGAEAELTIVGPELEVLGLVVPL